MSVSEYPIPKTGFLYSPYEAIRSFKLIDRISEYGRFSDSISTPDIAPRSGADVALMSFSYNEINYVCRARWGHQRQSDRRSVKFTDFIDIGGLAFDEIKANIPNHLHQYIEDMFVPPGTRLPDATFWAIWSSIRRLRPDQAGQIDFLAQPPERQAVDNSSLDRRALSEQRDSVGILMKINDFDYRDLALEPVAKIKQPKSFLDLVHEGPIREDAMVYHDAKFVPDWVPTDSIVGVSRFVKNSRILEVIVANREKLESTIGVDLIYWHRDYDAYSLVQYKRMRLEGEEFVYRPNGDESCAREVARMKMITNKFRSPATISSSNEFRMSSHMFFMKFCPSMQPDLSSFDMVRGMYLPLEWWEYLIKSKQCRGPRNGVRVTFDTVGRWLNNTQFVEQVSEGWVGSASDRTKVLREYIESALGSGRSVVIGIGERAY